MPSSSMRQADCSTASPGGHEVVDVADVGRAHPATVRLQPRLALGQRQRAQVLPPCEQQVEDEEHQVGLVFAVRDRRLQGGEVRRAGVVQRDDLAVDDAVGQAWRPRLTISGNLSVQSRPLRVRKLASPASVRSCIR